MSDRYELRTAIPDNRWDAFVEASPQGSVYSSAAYLTHMRDLPLLFYCMGGEQIKAAVALPRGATGPGALRSDLMIYNGLMCAPVDGNPSDAQSVLECFRPTTFMVRELASRYGSLDMQLSPAFVDIRPFLWYNYGTDGAKFAVDVRYTTYLDISACLADAESVLPGLRPDRRREVRNARRRGITTTEEFAPELCVEFHRATLERDGTVVPRATLDEMTSLMHGLHASGQGRMFVARGSDGTPASALFFGIDTKRAYAMFGGSDPWTRYLPSFIAVLWDAFFALRQSGVTEVDLEGVNSPRRGWFKLSLGGRIVPYFGLVLDPREVSGE